MKKTAFLFLVLGLMTCFSGCAVKDEMISPNTPSNEFLEPFNHEATIPETIIVDEQDIKITVNGLEYSSYNVELLLTIENNSNQNVEVLCGNAGYPWNSINGIMVSDGYMWAEVAAEETVEDSIAFSYNELEMTGINEIADIEIGLTISDEDYNDIIQDIYRIETPLYDSHDYAANLYQKTINNAIIANKYEYTVNDFKTDQIFNVSDVSIDSEAVITNKHGDTALFLEFNNNSQNDLYVHILDLTVNDTYNYSYQWDSMNISSGKKAIMNISLSNLLEWMEEIEASPIKIEKLEFELEFIDDVTYQQLYSQHLELNLPNIEVAFETE